MGQLTSTDNTCIKAVTEGQELEMQFPYWREAPPYVTAALHDRNYENRIECVITLRMHAFKLRPRRERKVVSPCHWCGSEANSWCEHCHEAVSNKPAHMLCNYCDKHIRTCRLCRLQRQLQHSDLLPSSHNLAMSAYADTWHCVACGLQAEGLQLCRQCKVARYCGHNCQKLHWRNHKRLCRLLRQLLPMAFVYSWHMSRAVKITRQVPELLPPIISLTDLDAHGEARHPDRA